MAKKEKDYIKLFHKVKKKRVYKACNENFHGKNIVYIMLRKEGKLTRMEIASRLGISSVSIDTYFNNPEKYFKSIQIEAIAYSLPNRTMKEILIGLTNENSLMRKWYEKMNDE